MGTRSQLSCGLVPVARHVINMTNSPGRKARNSVVTDVIGRRALGKLIDLINPLFLIKLCDPVMTDFCVKEKIKTPTATNETKLFTPLSTFRMTPKMRA